MNEKEEEQFNKFFKPMRAISPRTSLLTETLAKIPSRANVTIAVPKRLSYMGFFRSAIVVGFAAVLVFFSPLFSPMNVEDEVYAMEIEAEEIADSVEYDSLTLETDYLVEDFEGELDQFDELDVEVLEN